jgi:DNA-binding Lrp family transcriptional regulator
MDKNDQKLLNYLYHHNRETCSAIAKKTGLTREQVNYRINKYVKEGTIRKFLSVFNYKKLGYNHLINIFLKFKDQKSKEAFIKYPSANRVSWGNCYAKYDVYANYIFEDEKKLQKYLEKLSKDIQVEEFKIITPSNISLYPLKFLKNSEEELNMLTDDILIQLEEKEKKILLMLERDARARIVDIANELGISGELALYKMRKLLKEKIIIGSRIQFDMSKLGYYFTLLFIDTDITEQTRKKLSMFCKESKNVNSLIIQLNSPKYIIQVLHQTEKELRENIDDLKKLLNNELHIEIVPIGEDEMLVNTLPFID